MAHSGSQQSIDFGTGAPNDGETILSGMTKVDANFDYLFGLADAMPRYVNTVPDLENLSNPQNGEIVITRGYRTVGDGGSNAYYYNSSSTDTCDGALTMDGIGGDYTNGDAATTWAGSGTGRFKALDTSRITLLQAGAYGDGTNATINPYRIRAAIVACKRIIVPAGDFQIDATIAPGVVYTERTVEGVGWDSQITQNTDDTNIFEFQNSVDDWTIKDIRLSGTGTGSSTTENCGVITLATVENLTVDGCFFDNFVTAGVQLRGSSNAAIRNCVFFDQAGAGGTVSGDITLTQTNTDYVIENNKCVSDVKQSIYVELRGSGGGGTIRNNTLDVYDSSFASTASVTSRLYGIDITIISGTTQQLNIEDNLIANCRQSGVIIEGATDSTDRDIIVRGNYFKDNGNNAPASVGDLFLSSCACSLFVNNNTFEDYQGGGTTGVIWLTSDADASYVISSNTITATSARGCVFLLTCEEIQIVDNYIDVNNEGIDVLALSQSFPTLIQGNIIHQNADANGIVVNLFNTADRAVVQGNFLRNVHAGTDYSTQAGVSITTQNYSFVDNHIDGYRSGFRCASTFSGRAMDSTGPADVVHRGNTFVDCETVWTLEGATSNALVPVFNTTTNGHTTVFGGGASGIEVGIDAQHIGGNLIVTGTAVPTTGTWQQGDRVINSAVAATGTYEWVCYATGTPGSWRAIS